MTPVWLPTHAQRPGLHAGFWLRLVAWVIDGLILATVFVLVYLAVAHGRFAAHDLLSFLQAGSRVWLAWLVLPWLYYALCEASRWQATPGKLALGLKVTDEYGERIGFGRASGRYFGKILSGMIFDIGYLLAGWTPRKQALHDLIAGCCVVRRAALAAWRAERLSPSETAAVPPPRSGMPAWLIALAVLGVLIFVVLPFAGLFAAIAIPAYQSHALRAEVAQGVQRSERVRALIGEYIHQRGRLPANNRVLGLPEPDAIHARYVSSVRVVDGQVVVTYGNQANSAISGAHVVLAPVGKAAVLHWRCSSQDIRTRYLPQDCR